ncbi:MAG: nuclear transport factor 2 family protein [Proteobacteria bacterium]|nr:nuclear transport factor 2 family protein [Pseudomonadota bacterium]
MSNAQTLADHYIAAWNETDADARRALIARTWAEDATYVDPVMAGAGPDQISAMIGAAQARFPGFRFALTGKVDAYADKMRFTWGAGPAGAAPVVEGSDFAVLAGEKLKTVTGFLDKVPG